MTKIRNIKEIPKVELGVRLEGATTIETYLELAADNGRDLPFEIADDGYKYLQFQNLEHFHKVYGEIILAIGKESDFRLLIDRFAKSQSEHHVFYCEFFVSLSLHTRNGLNPWGIMDVVNSSCREAESKYGIRLRCIPMLSKDCDGDAIKTALSATIQHRSQYIIGLGIEGLDSKDLGKFSGEFHVAGHVGLGLTAYAGEWRNPVVVWDALNHLNVARIANGIAAVNDPELLRLLGVTELPISICPSVAYRLNLIGPEDRHPIFQMMKGGLRVSVTSDSPVFFETSITKELKALVKAGLSDDQLVGLLEASIHSSFMSVAEKGLALDQLRAYLLSP